MPGYNPDLFKKKNNTNTARDQNGDYNTKAAKSEEKPLNTILEAEEGRKQIEKDYGTEAARVLKLDQMAIMKKGVRGNTRDLPNKIKKYFLNVYKRNNSYKYPINYNYFIYCMECHNIYSNYYFIYENDENPIIYETGAYDLKKVLGEAENTEITSMTIKKSINVIKGTDGKRFRPLNPQDYYILTLHYDDGSFIEKTIESNRFFEMIITKEMELKKNLNQKSRITPHDSYLYCPYCGAPTNELYTGQALLEKLFGIYEKEFSNWKYTKPGKKQLMEVPKSYKRIPDWAGGGIYSEIYSFGHLLKMNLWKTLFNQLGEFQNEYKIRNDRERPKLTIPDYMRDIKYNVFKGTFQIGNYKKDLLIFTKNNLDELEFDNISDLLLIDEIKLKKDLALKKITNKGNLKGFEPGSMALLFETNGGDNIFIPVEDSFLDFRNINDLFNFIHNSVVLHNLFYSFSVFKYFDTSQEDKIKIIIKLKNRGQGKYKDWLYSEKANEMIQEINDLYEKRQNAR